MITSQNNKSTQLIRIYQKFLSDLRALIRLLKKLKDTLLQVEEALLISKKVSDKLDELYVLLLTVDTTLMAMTPIPYVGTVAKVVQKVVAKIKKVVYKAKTKVNKIERKIKPHREKLAKFRGYIDKTLKPLLKMESFIAGESKLHGTTYETTKNLPDSRYKNLSMDRLHSTSETLQSMLAAPMELVARIIDLLSKTQELIKQVEKLCSLISKVIKPIVKMIDELDRVTGGLKKLGKVLTKTLTVNLLFTKISLSIEKILNSAGNIPGINILTKMATKILRPILGSLGLKVTNIPGLGGGVGNLTEALRKLDVMEKLKESAQEQFTVLTSKESPETNFKSVNV